MKKICLALIILLAFSLRLYRLNAPLADWHSWRQADTAAVSRNFIKKGFDVLHPRFDDLSNVASGLENPEGYRFVEFPLYNFLHALLFKTLPIFNLEIWGRLLSIFSSLGSLVFLYLLVKKYLGSSVALLAAFFFAILPFNIYYSRVILPEPMMLLATLGMIYFFDRWIEGSRWLDWCLAIFWTISASLLKPFSLVFLLPVVYLGWRKWQFRWRPWVFLFLTFLISLLPFLFWRWWMTQFPEGIPFSLWLFNLGKIRFRGAFFWWLFAERVGKLILGGWGLILLGLGIIARPSKKEGFFFYSWLVAVLAYFTIVARGNVQHDYYQVLAIPIICVFLAKGAFFLVTAPRQYFSRLATSLLLITCVLFMFAFSWYQVRDFFNINNPAIVEAGKAVDRLVPRNAKVIAPYSSDTTFLYQTNRQGWPVGIEIKKMIELGATHYVNVNFEAETQWVMEKYRVLEKTNHYVIVELQ